jgi:hypothetical protein
VIQAFQRLPDRVIDALDQSRGLRLVLDRGLDDREFVAPEPRRHVGLLETAAQAIRHAFQEFIAIASPERVVDALEIVDIEVRPVVRRA